MRQAGFKTNVNFSFFEDDYFDFGDFGDEEEFEEPLEGIKSKAKRPKIKFKFLIAS